MRFIDAKRLVTKHEFVLVDRTEIRNEPYAILSHTWGRQLEKQNGEQEWGGEDDEILFADALPSGVNDQDKNLGRVKPDAWNKIQKASEAAQKRGCNYLWVDTCCINKENSAELEESINSMFAWYQQSKVCLVSLADLEVDSADEQGKEELKKCRWFKRGWTLQELIAPKNVEFYNREWKKVGFRDELVDILHDITGIHCEALTGERSCLSFTVAQRMKWAIRRETTRPEDRAYSLLGLFGVSMGLTKVYGVGAREAFRRLQLEIIQTTTDLTVFAWNPSECSNESPGGDPLGSSRFCSILADSPDQFQGIPEMKRMEPEGHYSATNKGVLMDATTFRIVPKDMEEYREPNQRSHGQFNEEPKPPLLFMTGYVEKNDHMICLGIYLQKIGSAHYARDGRYGVVMFKEYNRAYRLRPVPHHQCYIVISPEDVESILRKSHKRAIAVQAEYNPEPDWSMKVLDQVPERIWDYQERLFLRVGYRYRDVVRAVAVELRLLGQSVMFTVLLHQGEDKDKVFILDERNTKSSGVMPIFASNQRFDSVKWDDLAIDLAVQRDHLDVVAEGRSYRVSASLKLLEDGKKKLTLDIASDAYQQIERLKQKLEKLEGLEQRLGKLERHLNGKRIRPSDGDAPEEVAPKKHKEGQ